MRSLIFALLLAAVCGCRAVPHFDTATTPGIDLIVHPLIGGPSREIDTGYRNGRCVLEIRNRTSEPILVVMNGDGSEEGWRTPIVRWFVVDGSGEPVTGRPPGRCGNINSLQSEAVKSLDPGSSITLDRQSVVTPWWLPPGRYTAVIELEHDPALEWMGVPLGEHDPIAMARIRASQGYLVRSRPFPLVVRPREEQR